MFGRKKPIHCMILRFCVPLSGFEGYVWSDCKDGNIFTENIFHGALNIVNVI